MKPPLKYNIKLAEYFATEPHFFDGDLQKQPNTRKCMELPYQQTQAQLWDAVVNTLENLFFLETKVIAGFSYSLIDDFQKAIQFMPNNHTKLELLHILYKAIRLDINFIHRH
jgi:hypothetical protein